MQKQYEVFEEEYKGHKTIAIWQVDPAGNKVGTYPAVSFGLTKAKLILENIDLIKEIVEEN